MKELESLGRSPQESEAVQMRSCFLGVAAPVPGLGMQLSLSRLKPRRTDSAGSTALWKAGSQRWVARVARAGAHVIFRQGTSDPQHTATLA